MKKALILGLLILSWMSCDFVTKTNSDGKNKSQEEPAKTIRLRFGDMPNDSTTYHAIFTKNQEGNDKLIAFLTKELKKMSFKIEASSGGTGGSFNNCTTNTIITFAGTGIRHYYAKRTKAKPKNYYPDFSLTIYEFENDSIAKNTHDTIQVALRSGGFCNGKAPEMVLQNKNKLFYLSTRANMFVDYIVKCSELIKNYD